MGSIVKTEAPDNEKNDKPGLSLKLKISKTGTGFVADLKDGKDGNASNPLAGNNSLPPNPGNQTQAAAPKKRAKKNKSNSTESDENPKKAPKKRKTKAEKKAEELEKEKMAAKNNNAMGNNSNQNIGNN